MNYIEEKEEEMSKEISKTLNGLCPSFIKNSVTNVEWHCCDCKATGSSCICVWHITDTCIAGTWNQLSFIQKYNNKKEEEQNKELEKARSVINNSKDEKIEDRFEIMDIRE